MCCLICCMCMKKKSLTFRAVYIKDRAKIRHRRRENQMAKNCNRKKTGCQRICNENYGACCDRNRRCEKELIPTLALALASPKT